MQVSEDKVHLNWGTLNLPSYPAKQEIWFHDTSSFVIQGLVYNGMILRHSFTFCLSSEDRLSVLGR